WVTRPGRDRRRAPRRGLSATTRRALHARRLRTWCGLGRRRPSPRRSSPRRRRAPLVSPDAACATSVSWWAAEPRVPSGVPIVRPSDSTTATAVWKPERRMGRPKPTPASTGRLAVAAGLAAAWPAAATLSFHRTDYPIATAPPSEVGSYEDQPVALADLNGDGKLDVVISDFGTGVVYVLLNQGDGTFAPAPN